MLKSSYDRLRAWLSEQSPRAAAATRPAAGGRTWAPLLLALLAAGAIELVGWLAPVRAAPADAPPSLDAGVAPSGAAGAVIEVHPLTSAAALPSAARNVLVLYHSRTAQGRDVAVSGTVAIPRGAPPPAGWPVILWTHGTTGLAAACAPSRDQPGGPEHAYLGGVEALLDGYVRRGYAVVATDYAGLGTPGVQPYLLGVDEGRDALDLLRAARRMDRDVGSRYVVMGHSQGGQSALFTAAAGPSYAPELSLLGVAAMAPASHIPQQIAITSRAAKPTPILVFSVYVLQSYAAFHPQADLRTILTPAALAHLGDLQTGCFDQAATSGYWSAAVPSDQFVRPFGKSTVPGLLAATEPGLLKIKTPVLLAQGLVDTFIPPASTIAVARRLCHAGSPLTLRTYPGQDHVGVLKTSANDVSAWVADRFAGGPAPTTCPARR
jgi:pimeloyl-ACP methyl ester carboxylesterase